MLNSDWEMTQEELGQWHQVMEDLPLVEQWLLRQLRCRESQEVGRLLDCKGEDMAEVKGAIRMLRSLHGFILSIKDLEVGEDGQVFVRKEK